jgi:alpha-mannosidase
MIGSEVRPATRRLHMIGNGHLDVAWFWPQWDGLQEAWATFRSALDRMSEHPGFRFSASSACYYEWIELVDPQMFEEIKVRVTEGRWELVGGWWVEPDCNIPTGEAFVRQALYGQRFFQSRFGRRPNVGYNIDSFGHAATLPQLLQKAGLSRYVFLRPRREELNLPGNLFWWEAPDGSRVLAYRIPSSYHASAEDLLAHARRCLAEMDGHFDVACFFGVGNHGGGPTRSSIDTIDRLRQELEGVQVRFSSLNAFLDCVLEHPEGLPVYRGELQHHARGCYSAHSGVKLWNRRAEQQLLAAEKVKVMAQRVDSRAETEGIDRAWKSVLLNQFHDVLAGTAIQSVYEDVKNMFGEALAITGRVTHQSVQSIARQIDIPQIDGTTPVVVFNTHSWPIRTVVELEADRLNGANSMQDAHGSSRPLQGLRSMSTEDGNRRRVAFVAEVPSFGYHVYRAIRDDHLQYPAVSSGHAIDDSRFRLDLDPQNGTIRTLFDKAEGCDALLPGGGRAVVVRDDSDTWGHDRSRFGDEVGEFRLTSLRRVCDGPIKTVIRAESRFRSSSLVQDFTVLHGLDLVLVRVAVDWHEHHHALKLRWRVNVVSGHVTYQVPHGHLVRPANGDEEPGQAWVDVSGLHPTTGRPYGVAILNDGKYGFDVTQSDVGMTVLRSPVFAHHAPRIVDETDDPDVAFIDQGIQQFQYAIVPHAGSWIDGGVARRSAELNQPAIAFWHTGHSGQLPLLLSMLEIEPHGVELVALKNAEDSSSDTILRCLETTGIATTARVRLTAWDRDLTITLAPHELKTLRVPADPASPVLEVDLLELHGLPSLPGQSAHGPIS